VSVRASPGFNQSIYFTDNNGIALEATYWVEDPNQRELGYASIRFFLDPDPVLAISELAAGGLQSFPATKPV
jgi:hypothetical protein